MPSTLRELMAMLMQERTGFCDGDCYVEIDGERHYFAHEYVHKDDPCTVYRCEVRLRKNSSYRDFTFLHY